MTVRAKFQVSKKTQQPIGSHKDGSLKIITHIELDPVMSGSAENKAFFDASPSGKITIGCANPAAAAALEIGREYYIDFIPADVEKPAQA